MASYNYSAYIPRMKQEKAITGAYSFNPERRLRWLQRLCLWILKKLKCQHYDEYISMETFKVEFDSIVDLIISQSAAINRVYSHRCKYVILGRRAMMELQIELDRQLWFNFPSDFECPQYRNRMTFAGLTIIVVPWFEGVLCLERLD